VLAAIVLALPLQAVSPEQAKQMIVIIEAKLGGQEVRGSGIIVGLGSGRLYIATANHVVRRGTESAESIRVQFRWLPGESHAATAGDSQYETDLAVLIVAGADRLLPREPLPFQFLAPADSVRAGDEVYLIGNPNGTSWDMNNLPDKITKAGGIALEFRTNFIAPGHSGGALLNARHELIGMLKTEAPPHGQAVPIELIVKEFRAWRYPVQLAEASARAVTNAPAVSALPRQSDEPWGVPDNLLRGRSAGHYTLLERILDSVARLPGGEVNVALSVGPSLTQADEELLRVLPQALADSKGRIVLLHSPSEEELMKGAARGRFPVTSAKRPVWKGIDAVLALGYTQDVRPVVDTLARVTLRQGADFYVFPFRDELWDALAAVGPPPEGREPAAFALPVRNQLAIALVLKRTRLRRTVQ
jgi:hypothetical protein